MAQKGHKDGQNGADEGTAEGNEVERGTERSKWAEGEAGWVRVGAIEGQRGVRTQRCAKGRAAREGEATKGTHKQTEVHQGPARVRGRGRKGCRK